MKQVKVRAVHDGQKLKDAATNLLRTRLAVDKEPEPFVTRDKTTGLPPIECKHSAAPDESLTPERIADILLAQEIGWLHDGYHSQQPTKGSNNSRA